MKQSTRRLWDKQNQHEGDRARLFQAVQEAIAANEVLYPGSFVDIAASAVFPSVTYVDSDRRAEAFFADEAGVREIVTSLGAGQGSYSFVAGDYRSLALAERSYDLLISLYAGLVSEHCTEFLRVGGTLLVNPSHGDVAGASIDPRYALAGAVMSRDGNYLVSTENLDSYLIPRKPVELTPESVRALGRGIAYTKTAFAYLFRRIA